MWLLTEHVGMRRMVSRVLIAWIGLHVGKKCFLDLHLNFFSLFSFFFLFSICPFGQPFFVKCWYLFSLRKPSSFSPPPSSSFLQALQAPLPPSKNDPQHQTTNHNANTPPWRILFHHLTPPSCPCSHAWTRCRNSLPSLSLSCVAIVSAQGPHSLFLPIITWSGYLEGFLLNLGKDEIEKFFPKFSVWMTKRFDFALEYLTPIIPRSIPNNKKFVYFLWKLAWEASMEDGSLSINKALQWWFSSKL